MNAHLPLADTALALHTKAVEKPWGVDELPAPFANSDFSGQNGGKRIGEIWFEPPAALPELLIKYIFTSEKLSVQVHPTDAQAIAAGEGRNGKEECWVVVAAEPGAKLGIGFNEPIDHEAMRAAALDGSIEGLMTWHDVAVGDFFYIPANTVHAIGAGVSVIETQQNSDITYRLYDYGRGRELHLDKGIDDALGEVYDLARWHRHMAEGESAALVDGPFFRLDRVAGGLPHDVAARYEGRTLLVVPLSGEVLVAGREAEPGSCALAPDIRAVSLGADGLALLAQPMTARWAGG